MAKYKTTIPDWHISDKVLIDSANSLLSTFKIDNGHDIPYVAGYDKKGKTIFIDKNVYQELKKKKRDKWLIPLAFHEAIEKTLMLKNENKEYEYQYCHQIAFRMEEELLNALKIDKKEYNLFFDKYIKEIGDEKSYPDLPKNLDLTPYRDEKDYKTLERMAESFDFITKLIK